MLENFLNSSKHHLIFFEKKFFDPKNNLKYHSKEVKNKQKILIFENPKKLQNN